MLVEIMLKFKAIVRGTLSPSKEFGSDTDYVLGDKIEQKVILVGICDKLNLENNQIEKEVQGIF